MKKIHCLFITALIIETMVIGVFVGQVWFHLVIPAIIGAMCVLICSFANVSIYVRIKISQAMFQESCRRLESMYTRELTALVREMEIPTA